MKFKEKIGSVFCFCDENTGEELDLLSLDDGFFLFDGIYLDINSNVCTLDEAVKYSEIQTAVSLMQILIKEGLV